MELVENQEVRLEGGNGQVVEEFPQVGEFQRQGGLLLDAPAVGGRRREGVVRRFFAEFAGEGEASAAGFFLGLQKAQVVLKQGGTALEGGAEKGAFVRPSGGGAEVGEGGGGGEGVDPEGLRRREGIGAEHGEAVRGDGLAAPAAVRQLVHVGPGDFGVGGDVDDPAGTQALDQGLGNEGLPQAHLAGHQVHAPSAVQIEVLQVADRRPLVGAETGEGVIHHMGPPFRCTAARLPIPGAVRSPPGGPPRRGRPARRGTWRGNSAEAPGRRRCG